MDNEEKTDNDSDGPIPADEHPESAAQQLDQTPPGNNVHIVCSMYIKYIKLQIKHASHSLEQFEKDPTEAAKTIQFCQGEVRDHLEKLENKFEDLLKNSFFELAYKNFVMEVGKMMDTIDSKKIPSEEMQENFKKQVEVFLAILVKTGTSSFRGQVPMNQSSMPAVLEENNVVLEKPVNLDNNAIHTLYDTNDTANFNPSPVPGSQTPPVDIDGGADTSIPPMPGNSSQNLTPSNSPVTSSPSVPDEIAREQSASEVVQEEPANNAIEDTYQGDDNDCAVAPMPLVLRNSSPNFTPPNSPESEIEPGSLPIVNNPVPPTSGLTVAARQSPENVPSSSTTNQKRTSEEPGPVPLPKKQRKENPHDPKDFGTFLTAMSSREPGDPEMPPDMIDNLCRHSNCQMEHVENRELELTLDSAHPDDYSNLHDYLDQKMTEILDSGSQAANRNQLQGTIKDRKPLKALTKLICSGPMYCDPVTTPAEELVEIVEQSLKDRTDGFNGVYLTNDSATHLISEGVPQLSGNNTKSCHRQNKVFNPKSVEDLKSPKFQELLSRSMSLKIKEFTTITNFNEALYHDDEVLMKNPATICFCTTETPEPSTFNTVYDRQTLIVNTTSKETNHGNFNDYLNRLKAAGHDCYVKMSNNETAEKDNYELHKKVITSQQMIYGKRNKNGRKPDYCSYALSVPLNQEHHKPQLEELNKLPELIRPGGGLLQACPPDVQGTTEPKIYFGTPGSRRYARVENLASVHLNVGTAAFIVYAVNFEDIDEVREMLARSNRNLTSNVWPTEDFLEKWKIPHEKFIWSSGEALFMGPGTYYWMQSQGFTASVSWNVAFPQKLQLGVTAVLHDHFIHNNWKVAFPIGPMILNIMETKKFAEDNALFPTLKAMMAKYIVHSKIENFLLGNIPQTLTSQSDLDVDPVERCASESCKRVLDNTLYYYNDKTEKEQAEQDVGGNDVKLYCSFCYHTLAHERKKKIKVLIRSEMTDLCRMFDKYTPGSEEVVSTSSPSSDDAPSTSGPIIPC